MFLPDFGVAGEAPFKDLAEDMALTYLRQLIHIHDVEMAQQTMGGQGPGTSWSAHCRNEDHVHDFDPLFLLQVKGSMLRYQLSQQLERRLRAPLLFGGHVEVIHENDQLVAGTFWTEHAFFVLVDLGLNVLKNIFSSLSCT